MEVMQYNSDEEYHSMDEKEDQWYHERDIGVGGFGIVKLFVNKTTTEKVVLKECRSMNLSREFVDRWFGELEIIKRLNHQNIVHALELPDGLLHKPMGNVPFICMEYCDGGDLRKVLRKPENCCGLTEDQIRQICGDVNAGIRFLHSQKVIHRDLKPENILIKHQSNMVVYKLTDFGYSKSYDQNSVCTSLVGTMQYVAPEVIKSRLYHSSVDFWSFGVVVFECITGQRPFLHGSSSNNIVWIDLVAQKQPEIIHIYYDNDGITPRFSPDLPKPHRLSKIFEAHMTSWLQTALHYDDKMRGGRRNISEDAPCLSNMDLILSTKVISCVCMSTGEVYHFNVDNTTTYESLKPQIPISPQDQFHILPTGRMPQDNDLVNQDMQQGQMVGRLFVFNTVLEPSFKMMHTTNKAVSTLTAYGDSKFTYNETREAYAQVFFHIREHHALFKRLQSGHSAILYQLSEHCRRVQRQEGALADQHLLTQEAITMVMDMHYDDYEDLKRLIEENKVPQSLDNYVLSWQSSISTLQQRDQELKRVDEELRKLREERDSYFRMTDDLQTNYDNFEGRVEDYEQNYVLTACALYDEVRSSRNVTPERSMQDVLLKATQEAQSIIEESLNGYNFGQTFMALATHLHKIQCLKDQLEKIKSEVMKMNKDQRQSLWDMIVESNNPEAPLSYRRMKQSVSESSDNLALNGDSDSVINMRVTRSSAQELRTQFSEISISSVDSVNDMKLAESINNFSRLVSEEENTRLIHRNEELRKEFVRSLSQSLSTVDTNGKPPLPESGSQ